MKSLNSMLKDVTGREFTDYLETIRDGINDIFKSASSWISGHPAEFATFITSFERLVGALSGFNVGTFASGAMANLGSLFTIIGDALGKITGGELEEFAAFATTMAGPLGALFKAVSAGAPAMIAIFDRFKNFDFGMLVDKIIREVERMAKVIEGVLDLFSDSGLSDLLAYGLVWGRPVAKGFELIALAIGKIGKALLAMSGARMLSFIQSTDVRGAQLYALHLQSVADTATGILKTVAAISALAAAFAGLYAISKAIDNVQTKKIMEKYGLDDIDGMARDADSLAESMRSTREEYTLTIAEAEEAYTRAEQLRQKIMALNSGELTPEGHAELAESIAELNAIYPSLNAQLDTTTGFLDENTAAVLANAGALGQLRDSAMAAAAEQAMASTYAELFAARAKRSALYDRRTAVSGVITALTARRNSARNRVRGANDGRSYDRSAYNELADYSNQLSTVTEKYNTLTDAIEELDDEIGLSESAVEYMKNQYVASTEAMNEYAAGQEAITKNAASQTDAIQQVADAYENLKEAAQEALSEQLWGWEELEKQEKVTLDELLSYIEQRNKIAQQMSEGTETIRKYALSSGNEELLGYLAELTSDGIKGAPAIIALAEAIENQDYDKINAIAEAWGLFAQNYTAASNAVDSAVASPEAQMQEYANRVRPFSGYPGVFGASEASGTGVSGAQSAVDGIVKTFENGKHLIEDSAKNAASGANQIAPELRKSVPLAEAGTRAITAAIARGIVSGTPTAVGAMQALVSELRNVLLGIMNITVSPTITVTPRRRVYPGGAVAEPYSTGGMVYAANGKLIPFVPMGADTVPAMLTPGEFVVRRGAVNSVGLDFLRNINSLNLHAAYDSLVNRLQMPGAGGFITSNRDDHSSRTVNQYITNGGQHYSQRIASRWLHGI